ncbi:MAG: hypothetical protein Q6364_03935 [Candidatus Hermodarchaeota archaeon]|nr:hypothetical protein [Candidatus Hermodarchaeota archaeon]
MSRRITGDEDFYGRISPCPIPPNPSKKRIETNPGTSSSRWLVSERAIWSWLVSPQFAGWCGIGATVSVFLSITLAYLYWGYPGISPARPFSLAHIAYGLAGPLIVILMIQVLRIQHQYGSYLGRIAGVFGILMGFVIIFQALVRAGTPLGDIINPLVYRFSWLWVLILPVLLGYVFSPIFLRLDRKSGALFFLGLGFGALSAYSSLYIMATGFIPTIIVGVFMNIVFMGYIIAFSLILVIRGDNLI